MKKIKFFIVLIFIFSCSKENNSNQPNINTLSKFSIEKTTFLPFELVKFNSAELIKTAPDSIKIGSLFVKTNYYDSSLYGICPDLPEGEYNVIVNADNKFTITIGKLNIINPQASYDSIINFTKNIQLNSKYSSEIKFWEDIVKNEWSNLTESEKIKTAQFIEANKLYNNPALDLGDLSILDSLKGRYHVYNIDENFNSFKTNFTRSQKLLVAGIGLTVAGVYTAKTGIGLIGLGLGMVCLYKSRNEIDRILSNHSDAVVQIDQLIEIRERGLLKLKNDKESAINLIASCSNISMADENKSSTKWLFSGLKAITVATKEINYCIDLFSSKLFGVNKIEFNSSDYLTPTDLKKNIPLSIDNLSISNVSNSKIKLTLIKDVHNSIKIKTVSDLMDKTDFKFTIKYQSKYQNDVVVNATFDAQLTPFSLVGNWKCQNLSDFNENNEKNELCGFDTLAKKYKLYYIVTQVLLDFNIGDLNASLTDERKIREYTVGRAAAGCNSDIDNTTTENYTLNFSIIEKNTNSYKLKDQDNNEHTLNFTITDDTHVIFSLSDNSGFSLSNIKCVLVP